LHIKYLLQSTALETATDVALLLTLTVDEVVLELTVDETELQSEEPDEYQAPTVEVTGPMVAGRSSPNTSAPSTSAR
jgi:hypothetical protein